MRIADPESNTGATGRSSWLSPALLVVSAVWLVLWFVQARGYWDDAGFTHLEFARSIANGQEFRFDRLAVYGDTAPVWVCFLAATHAVIRDWVAAGKVLALAAVVFALAGSFQLARQLTRDLGRRNSQTFAAVTVFLIAVNPVFVRWAFSGSEIVAAGGLACWGLFAAGGRLTEPIAPRRLLAGCFCAGIAPLLRPEMLLFTALLGLILFVRWVNLPLRRGAKLRVFFGGFLLVGAPVIAWSLYAMHAFGTMLPNAYGASVGAPNESALGELLRAYAFEFPIVFFGILGLVLWAAVAAARRTRISLDEAAAALELSGWVLLLWTAMVCVFYLAHHARVPARYVLLTAPALTIALLALARKLWPRVYVFASVAGGVVGVTISLLFVRPAITAETRAGSGYAELAAYLRTLPATAPVAANRIGQLAFLSEHPVVDMTGLTRPGVLPLRWDGTDDRRVWWAHEQGARYMVLDHAPEPGATSLWSRDIPATSALGLPQGRAFDIVTVWKLPPSPTLPVPPDMPREDKP